MKMETLEEMRERTKHLFEITDEDIALIESSARRNEIIAIAAFKKGQSSPKIKQLEWYFYGTYYATSRMEYSIETPFIDCKITQGNDFNVYEGGCLLWINGDSYNFRTFDEAKAAAQAEFEKRVMECLDL